MPEPRETTNVPDSDVGIITQAYVDEGYEDIECIKVSNDNWTINGKS